METHACGAMGAQKTYLVRCIEAGLAEWEPRALSADVYHAARQMAEIIDHDEARILSFGGKTLRLELQASGKTSPMIFEITGYPVYRYRAQIAK